MLKNFKIDSNRETLVITKLNQDISEIQLQALIINTVSNVRNAYWDYVFAVQSVEVARRSVVLADQLVGPGVEDELIALRAAVETRH